LVIWQELHTPALQSCTCTNSHPNIRTDVKADYQPEESQMQLATNDQSVRIPQPYHPPQNRYTTVHTLISFLPLSRRMYSCDEVMYHPPCRSLICIASIIPAIRRRQRPEHILRANGAATRSRSCDKLRVLGQTMRLASGSCSARSIRSSLHELQPGLVRRREDTFAMQMRGH
jgi:hypothetical protein